MTSDFFPQEAADKKLIALAKKTKAKRQTLPPQDQPPLREAILTDGKVFRVFQRLQNGIFAILGQLYENDGITPIGTTIPITNSTSHQIWSWVTPNVDGNANVFFVFYKGVEKVYRQPYNRSENFVANAQAIPVFDGTIGYGGLPHYSADFDSSTNRTYIYITGNKRVSINTQRVIWSVYVDPQGTSNPNEVINLDDGNPLGSAAQDEDFPVVSRSSLACARDTNGKDLVFLPNPSQRRLLIITDARGNPDTLNRLNIGIFNNGSRVFVWQQAGGKVFFHRLSTGPVYSWLEPTNGVLVYALSSPAVNGEPQPNVIVKDNSFYIVGREQCQGSGGIGICMREYQIDGNDTLINRTPIPRLVINDTEAQFPMGIIVSNGRLSVTACKMIAGDCVALLINADALNPTSILPTIPIMTSMTNLTNRDPSHTIATTIETLSAQATTSNLPDSLSSLATATLTPFDMTTAISTMMSLTATSNISEVVPSTSLPFFTTMLSGATSTNKNTAAIAGGISGAFCTLLLVGVLAAWWWLRGKNRENDNETGSVELGIADRMHSTQYDSTILPFKDNVINHQVLPPAQNSEQGDNTSALRYSNFPQRASASNSGHHYTSLESVNRIDPEHTARLSVQNTEQDDNTLMPHYSNPPQQPTV